MNTFEAISNRRSIRRFTDKELSKETVTQILEAAILAPSAKNGQPWKFIVVTNSEKAAMQQAMERGMVRCREEMKDNPYIDRLLAGAANTTKIMGEAPVTVFVFNTDDPHPWLGNSANTWLSQSVNTQSIGAAIENMILAAEDLGVGSLWICDVFFAYQEICDWLGQDLQLVAAVSLGYADEAPGKRPRKALDSVVEWR